jgi:hypothetical protein
MQLVTLELEDDYLLIGIHSTEEDYRLAYLLNKHINTKFVRFKHELDFENSNAKFPLFEFKDDSKQLNYYLINNKFRQLVINQENQGLFNGNYTTITYLIPEKKNVDFFLKIEGCNQQNFLNSVVQKLNNIQQVITSYTIEPNLLKSKDHLTF